MHFEFVHSIQQAHTSSFHIFFSNSFQTHFIYFSTKCRRWNICVFLCVDCYFTSYTCSWYFSYKIKTTLLYYYKFSNIMDRWWYKN